MSKRTDMTGQVFGRLTVVSAAPDTLSGAHRWRCVCECGVERIVTVINLNSGHTKSCGCLREEIQHAKREDLTGQKFGRLTALSPVPNELKWLCKCECGVEKVFDTGNIKHGKSLSCGCLQAEMARAANQRAVAIRKDKKVHQRAAAASLDSFMRNAMKGTR